MLKRSLYVLILAMLTIFVTGGVLAQDEPIELTIGGITAGKVLKRELRSRII